jgi:hypothetical protein
MCGAGLGQALTRLRRKLFGLTWAEELEQMVLYDIAMRGFWDTEQAMKELEIWERIKAAKAP